MESTRCLNYPLRRRADDCICLKPVGSELQSILEVALAMRFHVIRPQTHSYAQSPIRVIEHETGREVGWVNRYLDREYVRRLSDTTLRSYAYSLLHFVRWWESLHHTGDVIKGDLTESTLLDYLKFQCNHQPPFSSPTINFRVGVADCALRNGK